jgi:hypothetical protein
MTHKIRLYGLVALPMAFGLAACSRTTVESPEPAPEPAVAAAPVADTLVVRADTAAIVVTPPRDTAVSGYQASGAAGMTQSLSLTEVNGSGFTGNAVLTDLGGGKTRVALTLNAPANTDKEADHDAHIHTGTCAAPGPVTHPLTDARGNGEASDSEVDLSITALQDGNHIIQAHEDNGDRAIACAAIAKSGM